MKASWLLVMPTVPGSASSLRVWVWRRLRSFGGLYLQSGTCLLPKTADVSRGVMRVADRVKRDGGSCRVLSIQLSDSTESKEIMNTFNSERSDEYGEITSEVPAFLDELIQEQARGRVTYTEVEENESRLQRLRTWFDRVQARDYFGASGSEQAAKEIDKCAAALAAFEEKALSAEG